MKTKTRNAEEKIDKIYFALIVFFVLLCVVVVNL